MEYSGWFGVSLGSVKCMKVLWGVVWCGWSEWGVVCWNEV